MIPLAAIAVRRWPMPAAIALAVFAAAALGWYLGQPKPVQETYAPAQKQADGSIILERRPDAQAKPHPASKPACDSGSRFKYISQSNKPIKTFD